jgi:hypothetical protein
MTESPQFPRHDPLPDRATAADMLGVPASFLAESERRNIDGVTRYLPRELLEMGVKQRRRSLNSIAAKLLDHARLNGGDDDVAKVEAEIDSFFEGRGGAERDRFLAEARYRLSAELAGEVENELKARP